MPQSGEVFCLEVPAPIGTPPRLTAFAAASAVGRDFIEFKAPGEQFAPEVRLVRDAVYQVVGVVDHRDRSGSLDDQAQQPSGIRHTQHADGLLSARKEPRSFLETRHVYQCIPSVAATGDRTDSMKNL